MAEIVLSGGVRVSLLIHLAKARRPLRQEVCDALRVRRFRCKLDLDAQAIDRLQIAHDHRASGW